jgi:hypothetical protein
MMEAATGIDAGRGPRGRRTRRARLGGAAALVLALGAVAASCDGGEPPAADAPGAQLVDTAAVEGPVPDTTVVGLWAYLEREDYRASWRLWPGTDARFESAATAHGPRVTVYVSPIALPGVTDGDTLAYGSVLVAESFANDGSLKKVSAMLRAPSFDPAHGDWFWVERRPDGTVGSQGAAPSCIGCHGGETGAVRVLTPPGATTPERTDRAPGPQP